MGRDAVMRAVASAVLQADALEHALLAALPLGPQGAAGGVSLPDLFQGELQASGAGRRFSWGDLARVCFAVVCFAALATRPACRPCPAACPCRAGVAASEWVWLVAAATHGRAPSPCR